MFSTADVAAASGVEKATIRSWLARAPGFRIGAYDGHAKTYTGQEALGIVIAGELIGRGYGTPFEVLPTATRIARGRHDHTVWVYRDEAGAIAFTDQQPNEVAVALPLPSLAARLRPTAGNQRIARTTR